MAVVHGSEVFDELVEISFQIALDDESSAQKFLDACDETFNFLAINKYVGEIRDFGNPLLNEVRMWRVRGFEHYLIFYHPLAEGIEDLHIVHGSRNYDLLFRDK